MNIDLIKIQQYLEWLKEKIYLNYIAPNAQKRQIYRGEVYRCKFGVGIGSEENKERPCVILQYDSANKSSPNTIVAPISHTCSTIPVVVPIESKQDSSGKIILDGNVLLGNITCVSKARLGVFITKLAKQEMSAIDKAIAMSLGILHHYESLKNTYDDRTQYLHALQKKTTSLENDLNTLQQQIDSFQIIFHTYGFSDIQALNNYLAEKK